MLSGIESTTLTFGDLMLLFIFCDPDYAAESGTDSSINSMLSPMLSSIKLCLRFCEGFLAGELL
jgi:hypothetical protein